MIQREAMDLAPQRRLKARAALVEGSLDAGSDRPPKRAGRHGRSALDHVLALPRRGIERRQDRGVEDQLGGGDDLPRDPLMDVAVGALDEGLAEVLDVLRPQAALHQPLDHPVEQRRAVLLEGGAQSGDGQIFDALQRPLVGQGRRAQGQEDGQREEASLIGQTWDVEFDGNSEIGVGAPEGGPHRIEQDEPEEDEDADDEERKSHSVRPGLTLAAAAHSGRAGDDNSDRVQRRSGGHVERRTGGITEGTVGRPPAIVIRPQCEPSGA